ARPSGVVRGASPDALDLSAGGAARGLEAGLRPYRPLALLRLSRGRPEHRPGTARLRLSPHGRADRRARLHAPTPEGSLLLARDGRGLALPILEPGLHWDLDREPLSLPHRALPARDRRDPRVRALAAAPRPRDRRQLRSLLP